MVVFPLRTRGLYMSWYRAPMPIFLYDKATKKQLFEISDAERQ